MKKNILWVIVPCLFIVAFFIEISQPKLIINPGDRSVKIHSFNDSDREGNSQVVSLKQSDESITCDFIVGSKYRYPYTGYELSYTNSNTFLDISQYDKVTIYVDASKSSSMNLTLPLFVDDISDSCDWSTWLYRQHDINVSDNREAYTLRFRDFKTPSWWYSMNNFPESKNYRHNYDKCGPLTFTSHHTAPLDTVQHFVLKRVVFSKDMGTLTIKYLALFLLSSVLIFILYLLRYGKKVPVPYSSQVKKSFNQNDLERVLHLIGEKYAESGLTLSLIEKETGVSTSRIRSLLTKELGKSFKEYVCDLRIHEAKRLLCESDMQVTEVAHAVGYQHVTSFSKLFKTQVGLSPNQFRTDKCS